MKSILSFLVLMFGAFWVPSAFGLQATCESGYRDDRTCPDQPHTTLTPLQAMLRWTPSDWQRATLYCFGKDARNDDGFGHVACSTIISIQSLCTSELAGSRAKEQCIKWGLRSLPWNEIALDATRSLAIKVAELPEVKRPKVMIAEVFIDVAANQVVKEFVARRMGSACANLLNAITININPPRSGWSVGAGVLDTARPMAHAIGALIAHQATEREFRCSAMNASPEVYKQILSPRGIADCNAEMKTETQKRAIEFANVVVKTIESEYSCKARAQ